MKTKKIFAALAACAMAVAVTGVTSFAAPLDEEPEEVVDEETEEIIEEDTDDDFTDEDFEDDFDDEDFDDFYDDEDFDEDFTDDTADDEGDPTDVGDAGAENSPKTGNAPVALAVIPVALAAAAVVAKKSK